MADHYAIGEVLALLKGEFADITISKIRFLESQGLLTPQRSASGYRRFYQPDIDQLRWILRQQRENFLPLKIIRERIDAGDVTAEIDRDSASVATAVHAESIEVTPTQPGPRQESIAAVEPSVSVPRPAFWAGAAARATSNTPALFRTRADQSMTSVSLTLDELVDASALDRQSILELERFGLLSGRSIGVEKVYEDDALLIARLSARLIAHGLEPRHLRMYLVGAQREAGVIEQIVQPLTRQNNSQASERSNALLSDLVQIGGELRESLLKQSLTRLA